MKTMSSMSNMSRDTTSSPLNSFMSDLLSVSGVREITLTPDNPLGSSSSLFGTQQHDLRSERSDSFSSRGSSSQNRSCRWGNASPMDNHHHGATNTMSPVGRWDRKTQTTAPPELPPSPTTWLDSKEDSQGSSSKQKENHRWKELHQQVSSPTLPSRRKFQVEVSPTQPSQEAARGGGRATTTTFSKLPPSLRALPY